MAAKPPPKGALTGSRSLPTEPNPALMGIIKAYGIGSAKAVKAIGQTAQIDLPSTMSTVAAALLEEGMRSRKIPPNSGRITEEFLITASAAVEDVVRDYHMKGNPLTSRYVEPELLVEEVWRIWKDNFSTLAHSKEKDLGRGMKDPEIQDRLTVVALRAREIVLEKMPVVGSGDSLPPGYFLDENAVEGFCSGIAKALFEAFNSPNETNHALIHKEKK